MIRGRTLRPTCTFTPCSRGGSGAANTPRGPGCLRKQNWPVNSAASPTPPRGRSGHSNATDWPGRFSEEGTCRPDRMLIQASNDASSRLHPHAASAPPPSASRACPPYTRGQSGSSAGRSLRGSPHMPLRAQVSRMSNGAASAAHPSLPGLGPRVAVTVRTAIPRRTPFPS